MSFRKVYKPLSAQEQSSDLDALPRQAAILLRVDVLEAGVDAELDEIVVEQSGAVIDFEQDRFVGSLVAQIVPLHCVSAKPGLVDGTAPLMSRGRRNGIGAASRGGEGDVDRV